MGNCISLILYKDYSRKNQVYQFLYTGPQRQSPIEFYASMVYPEFHVQDCLIKYQGSSKYSCVVAYQIMCPKGTKLIAQLQHSGFNYTRTHDGYFEASETLTLCYGDVISLRLYFITSVSEHITVYLDISGSGSGSGF